MDAVVNGLKKTFYFVFKFFSKALRGLSKAKKTLLAILIVVSSLLTFYHFTVTKTNRLLTNRIATLNDNFQKRLSAVDRAVNQRMKEYDLLFPHVTCVRFHGGLGNNLFQYASSYGLSRAIGLDVVILPSSAIYQFFTPVARIVVDAKLCSQLKMVTEKGSSTFDPSLFNLTPDSDYRFQNYLQSWKYFHHVKDEIRQQLKFRGDILSKASEKISKAVSNLSFRERRSKVYVGLHVRRGNYLEPYYVKFGYKVANMTYINKAMTYFNSKYDDVIFLVLSNDMWWCKRNINRPDVYFIEDNLPEVDLAIISLLNHTIMTVGTFGFWGAWLCNGDTVYMRDFFVPGSEYAKQFANTDDFFLDEWLGL